MRVHFLLLILAVFCIVGLTQCSLLELDGPMPAFIEISDLQFEHGLNEGPPTHNIKHVEVFFENKSLGYYELPIKLAIIPTLEKSTLVIKPAIRENGQKNFITTYVLMTNYSITQTFETNKVYPIKPVFQYLPNVKVPFLETFEDTNDFIFNVDKKDSLNQDTLFRTNEMAAFGDYSGKIKIEKDAFISMASEIKIPGLRDKVRVFAEFEYKNEIPLVFGLVGYKDDIEAKSGLIALQEKTDWNKIYIDLTKIIALSDLDEYRLFFEARDSKGPGNIFIDNVKLLYLE